MKRISHRAVSSIFLVAGFCMAAAVSQARVDYIGDPRYQTVDPKSLQNLEDLLNQKKINFDEFNIRLNILSHHVQAVDLHSGSAASVIAPPARAPSAIPLDVSTSPVVSTGTVQSTGTLPAPVSTSTVSGFVYLKWGTNLNIQIKDDGYGLSEADKARMTSYLDRLPVDQLAGLQEIILRPDPSGHGASIEQNGKQIILNRARNSDPGFESALTGDLAQGIGKYVYSSIPDIRNAWQALAMPYRLAGGTGTADNFAVEYAAYTSGSIDQMAWAVGDPKRKLVGLTTCFSSAPGPESCTTAQPEPEKDVPAMLVIASLFAHQNTANVNTYTTKPNGDIRLRYAAALRNNDWLTISGYSFRLEKGKIVGWSTGNVFDILNAPPKYDASGQQVFQAILSINFQTPIDIPQVVLNRVVKK